MHALRRPLHHLLPRDEHAVPLPEELFLPVEGQVVAVLADQQLRQQTRRGQAVLGHAGRRGRDHRRQRPLRDAHILGPHGFLPEELAGLIIQPPAHFLADALPVLRLGLHQLGFDHLADDFQVVRRAHAPRVRAGRSRWGNRRRLVLCCGEFQTPVGQTAQEQFQLGRVQLLALLAEETPGQRIELLAQQGVLAAGRLQSLPGLLQRLLQGRHLLTQRVDFLLPRSRVHLNC